MTVKELIQILSGFQEDLEVRIDGFADIEIFVNDEYYDGDSANPKCPVIKCVEIK